VAAAVVGLVGLLAAGCGESAPTGPRPIKIGALVPVSALALDYYVAGFEAAARDINGRGGVRGRPVEVEICDDRNDPNEAQACARQLVSDGVIATAASISVFSMVEGPILDEAGIPQVGNEAINPEDSNLPTAFPLDGGIVTQMAGGIVGIKRRGLHTMFVVTLDTPPGRTIVQLAGQLVRPAEIGMAGAAYVPAAASDLTSYVQAAMQSRADVVFPALPPYLTLPFLMASRHAGARYLIMVPYGEFTPRDIAMMGGRDAITENDIEFTALPPLSATDRFPAVAEFASDMDAELAAGDAGAAAELRTGGTLQAWLTVQIIAREASELTTIDAPSLLRALRTRPTVDTMGLTPPWAPSRTGPPGFPRATNLFGYLVSQWSGVEVLTDPTPFSPFQVLRLSG